jgi:hypothetical protein
MQAIRFIPSSDSLAAAQLLVQTRMCVRGEATCDGWCTQAEWGRMWHPRAHSPTVVVRGVYMRADRCGLPT